MENNESETHARIKCQFEGSLHFTRTVVLGCYHMDQLVRYLVGNVYVNQAEYTLVVKYMAKGHWAVEL